MTKRKIPREHYYSILSNIGIILLLGGGLLLSPLLYLPANPAEMVHSPGFLIPAAILGGAGLFLWRRFRGRQRHGQSVQDASVVVFLSWLVVCAFSTFPFIYSLKLNFTQAFFEVVSGFTTTGLSVVDVVKAPRVILLWRSIMQFAGGAGLAIIMLAAIAGPVGSGLYVAEGRGQQLAPHVKESAKLVMMIYCGYIAAGVFAYVIVGMSLFDAINHSIAAVSTGGFATHVESIGYWNSPAVEAVTIVLMILGNLNFLTAYFLLRGNVKAFVRNGEVKLMATLLPVSALVLFTVVTPALYPQLDKSVRVAIFEAASALTTTGFSTVGYTDWNATGYLVMIVLMLIGGGACSTAGGLKQYRAYLMFKTFVWEIKRNFRHKYAVAENFIWQGERKDYIDDERIRQILTFAFIYFSVYVCGVLILTIAGYELKNAMFEYASSIGTVGLSIGITAPGAEPYVLWAETAGMFLGRLEFFVVFVSLGKLVRGIFSR